MRSRRSILHASCLRIQLSFPVQQGSNMGNDLSFTRKKIVLTELFLFVVLWTINFFAFHRTRGLKIIPHECFFVFVSPRMPVEVTSFIRYGVWVPFFATFICSFLMGFHAIQESLRKCVLAFLFFFSYAAMLELLYPITISNVNYTASDWILLHMVSFVLIVPIAHILGGSVSIFFSTLLRRKSCQH
jgi:hypothetical protein